MNKFDQINALLAEGRAIIAKAEARDGHLTDKEATRTTEIIGKVSGLRLEAEVNALSARSIGDGSGLFAKFLSAGWRQGQRTALPEFKASDFTGNLDDLSPTRRDIGAIPADRRYAFPAFPTESVSDGVTSITTLKQSERDLADPDDMKRAIDAVSPKPQTTAKRALSTESMFQFATVSDPIPAILALNGFDSLLQNELRLAHAEALDKHVLDEIAAANPADSGTGDSNLIAAVRHGISDLEALGLVPDTLLIGPDDFASLDLFRDGGVATESYIYATASRSTGAAPLWGMRIRVSKSVVAPILCDASALGRLYASPLALDSDDRGDNFVNNSVVYRIENHALFVVTNIDAAREIIPAVGS